MSSPRGQASRPPPPGPVALLASRRRWPAVWAVVIVVTVIAVIAAEHSSHGRSIVSSIQAFLLTYAGVFALIGMTAAVGVGLLATDRIVMRPGHRVVAQSVHRGVSLGALAALVVHITLEIVAHKVGVLDVVVPFLSRFRTLYTGLGTLAADLFVLIVVTGFLRGRFAGKWPWAWRAIHAAAYAAWPLAVVHGLLGGRTAKPYVDWSYGACLALVAVALAIRVVATVRNDAEKLAHPVSDRLSVPAEGLIPGTRVALAPLGAGAPGPGALGPGALGPGGLGLGAPRPLPAGRAGWAGPGQAQHGELQHEELQHGEPRYGEPRYAEPRYAEPRYAEPGHAEPRYAEPGYAEPEYGEAGYGEAEYGVQHSQPQRSEFPYSQSRAPRTPYSPSPYSPSPYSPSPYSPSPSSQAPYSQPRYAQPQHAPPRYPQAQYSPTEYSQARYSQAQELQRQQRQAQQRQERLMQETPAPGWAPGDPDQAKTTEWSIDSDMTDPNGWPAKPGPGDAHGRAGAGDLTGTHDWTGAHDGTGARDWTDAQDWPGAPGQPGGSGPR
jgi:hypothetical protein